jgi:hypothetical protein
MKKQLLLTALAVIVSLVTTLSASAQVLKVEKDGNKRTAYFKDGSSKDFYLNQSDSIPLEYKEAVLRGEAIAIDPEHKGYDAKSRHHKYISVFGGAGFEPDHIAPIGGIKGGWEYCHWYWCFEGAITTGKYPEGAIVEGTYLSYFATVNIGWKFWQSNTFNKSLSVYAGGGFGGHQTDKDVDGKTDWRSANSGLICQLALKYNHSFGKRFSFFVEGGARTNPGLEAVNHSSGEYIAKQGFRVGGFAQVGISLKFR